MKEHEEPGRGHSRNVDFRKFLETFKTQICPEPYHPHETCRFFHVSAAGYPAQELKSESYQPQAQQLVSYDRRRNPYGKLNRIVYFAEYCPNIGNGCQNQECLYCHNLWEYNYHPWVFKTAFCELFYDTCFEYCWKLHYHEYAENPKTRAPIFKFSQFFRFDIMTFKSQPCKKEYNHDRNFCIYYHNKNDYRRPNFDAYDHIECKEPDCKAPDCPFSHNKSEQLYHPSRYKSKYCEANEAYKRSLAEGNNSDSPVKIGCPYGKFCSFAHDDSEVSFELIDKMQKNLEFHLYAYKTVWCPVTSEHNRSNCVYAHNIQDYRRNPKEYYYEPVECPFWKKNQNIKSIEDAGCPDGMACSKCHGWKEKQYHPVIYSKNRADDVGSKGKEKSGSYTSSDGGKEKISSNVEHQIRKEEIVSKKLAADFNKNNYLEHVVAEQVKANSKKMTHKPGAPFFKNDRLVSKTRTQSEKGQKNLQGSDKTSQAEERGSIVTTKNTLIMTKSNEEDFINGEKLFKLFEGGEKTCDQKNSCINFTQKNHSESGKSEENDKKVARTVSKSLGNRSRYSKQIAQMLNPQIISVLRQKNIHEIKLLNMNDEEIRQIEDLTSSQKSLIISKIGVARQKSRKALDYDGKLEKYFIKYKKGKDLLTKMKTKNVGQDKLLLMNSEIRDLSFLSETEKQILPKIITEFNDNQEFEQLSYDIAKQLVAQGE